LAGKCPQFEAGVMIEPGGIYELWISGKGIWTYNEIELRRRYVARACIMISPAPSEY